MVRVELVNYKLSRLDLLNRVEMNGPIRLTDEMDFAVKFEDDDNCLTEVVLTECMELESCPGQLRIELEVEGVFEIEGVINDATKKEAHVKCYEQLFPYANQMARHLAVELGIPGLALKKRDMDNRDIHIGGKSGDGGSEKIIDFKPDGGQS